MILGKLLNPSVSVYTALKWNDNNNDPRTVAKFLTYYLCSVMSVIIIILGQYL